MKICLISPWCYRLLHPEDKKAPPFGGAEVQQVELGKAILKHSNHKVSFMVGDFYPKQPRDEMVSFERKKVRVCKAIRCTNRIFGVDSLLDVGRLYRAMKALDADVYVLRGGGSLAGTVAFLARRVFGKKFIYSSAHDRDSNGEFFNNHLWLINCAFKYGLRNAHVIVCQHRDQQVAFKERFGLEAKVIKTMVPLNAAGKTQHKKEYVLWVARLSPWKQPEIFVELAKRFPQEKFCLITNSDAYDLRKVVERIENLELIENVPLEKTDNYFARAKVFVNTSVSEGFPNTFVQAAKNGTPILSLNVDPERMLEQYQIGQCAKGSVEQLQHDLGEMLKDQNLWRKRSRNAYNYAKQVHDRDKIVKDYLTLLET